MNTNTVQDETGLSSAERLVFRTLTEEQKTAFMVVRDTAKCAAYRIRMATKLPDDALSVINNQLCKATLRSRGIAA